jgi:hypothetical protein
MNEEIDKEQDLKTEEAPKKVETPKERQQKLNNINSVRANAHNQGSKGKHSSKLFQRRSNG